MNPLSIVVLAAGASKRMNSDLIKVMHPLVGMPLLGHVGQTISALSPQKIILVTGPQDKDLLNGLCQAMTQDLKLKVESVVQDPPQGTGHAVRCAYPLLKNVRGDVLVVYGDTPLITPATLIKMIEEKNRFPAAAAVVLGMRLQDPGQYGRLVIDAHQNIQRIVEFKNATPEERSLTVCNSGVMMISGASLGNLLESLVPNPVTQEYYLTDIIEIAARQGQVCRVIEGDACELEGINTRLDLAKATAILQQRYRKKALEGGATLEDPESTYFCYDTVLGRDVTIGPQVFFGKGVKVSDHVRIHPFCHIEGATLEEGVIVGPFARLRPGTVLQQKVEIGNFVETKNLTLGKGSKIKHLSYVSDAVVGDHTNVGAGTITCNYDGFNKWQTVVGDNVMIGSNTALVAPVTIGAGAVIGAGSVITDEVAPGAMAIARSRQSDLPGRGHAFCEERKKIKRETTQKI